MKHGVVALPFLLLGGCLISVQPVALPTITLPTLTLAAPTITVAGPEVVEVAPEGGEVVVEPAFGLREYVYEPGFPPGCYLYGGYYYYGGRRFDHDYFHRFAERNLRDHRFEDSEKNRREATRHQEQHKNPSRAQPHGGAKPEDKKK